MATVSVIIPCYNQGHFLDETIDSVLRQTLKDFEIIVVNDGSTDPATIRILKESKWPKVRVLHTENQGLASARNNGIAQAHGSYILPLDADDLIEPTYLEKAVALLEEDAGRGIVYCKARRFGAVDSQWDLPPYSLDTMLLDNVIFCSAMFRRSDWVQVGGYDAGMIYGWEDYDFWLSLIEMGRSVYQIPEVLFAYRVSADSMVRTKDKWQKLEMFKRIYRRHQQFFSDNIEVWLGTLLDAGEPHNICRLYLDCGDGISDETSLNRNVSPGCATIYFDLAEITDIQALRFDPANLPVVIQLENIIAECKDGSKKELTYTCNAASQDERGRFYFDDNDSTFLLELSKQELQDLQALTVNLHYLAFGDEALSQLIRLQQSLLQKNSHRVEQSSGAVKAFWQSLKRQADESLKSYLTRQLHW